MQPTFKPNRSANANSANTIITAGRIASDASAQIRDRKLYNTMVRNCATVMDRTEGKRAVEALELKLYQYLGIPVEHCSNSINEVVPNIESATIVAIRELRRELFELRTEASHIGSIPRSYPAHVVLVMKIISAILPWYTRPLVHFAQRAARTAELTAQLVEKSFERHELLAREVAEFKKQIEGPQSERAQSQ